MPLSPVTADQQGLPLGQPGFSPLPKTGPLQAPQAPSALQTLKPEQFREISRQIARSADVQNLSGDEQAIKWISLWSDVAPEFRSLPAVEQMKIAQDVIAKNSPTMGERFLPWVPILGSAIASGMDREAVPALYKAIAPEETLRSPVARAFLSGLTDFVMLAGGNILGAKAAPAFLKVMGYTDEAAGLAGKAVSLQTLAGRRQEALNLFKQAVTAGAKERARNFRARVAAENVIFTAFESTLHLDFSPSFMASQFAVGTLADLGFRGLAAVPELVARRGMPALGMDAPVKIAQARRISQAYAKLHGLPPMKAGDELSEFLTSQSLNDPVASRIRQLINAQPELFDGEVGLALFRQMLPELDVRVKHVPELKGGVRVTYDDLTGDFPQTATVLDAPAADLIARHKAGRIRIRDVEYSSELGAPPEYAELVRQTPKLKVGSEIEGVGEILPPVERTRVELKAGGVIAQLDVREVNLERLAPGRVAEQVQVGGVTIAQRKRELAERIAERHAGPAWPDLGQIKRQAVIHKQALTKANIEAAAQQQERAQIAMSKAKADAEAALQRLTRAEAEAVAPRGPEVQAIRKQRAVTRRLDAKVSKIEGEIRQLEMRRDESVRILETGVLQRLEGEPALQGIADKALKDEQETLRRTLRQLELKRKSLEAVRTAPRVTIEQLNKAIQNAKGEARQQLISARQALNEARDNFKKAVDASIAADKALVDAPVRAREAAEKVFRQQAAAYWVRKHLEARARQSEVVTPGFARFTTVERMIGVKPGDRIAVGRSSAEVVAVGHARGNLIKLPGDVRAVVVPRAGPIGDVGPPVQLVPDGVPKTVRDLTPEIRARLAHGNEVLVQDNRRFYLKREGELAALYDMEGRLVASLRPEDIEQSVRHGVFDVWASRYRSLSGDKLAAMAQREMQLSKGGPVSQEFIDIATEIQRRSGRVMDMTHTVVGADKFVAALEAPRAPVGPGTRLPDSDFLQVQARSLDAVVERAGDGFQVRHRLASGREMITTHKSAAEVDYMLRDLLNQKLYEGRILERVLKYTGEWPCK